ncbi:MAG: hypothetical protein V4465_02230 [Patescibacteria group bacterium]
MATPDIFAEYAEYVRGKPNLLKAMKVLEEGGMFSFAKLQEAAELNKAELDVALQVGLTQNFVYRYDCDAENEYSLSALGSGVMERINEAAV